MTEPPDEARRRYDDLYRRSLDDGEAFWLEAARRLDWTRPPDRALELGEPPTFAWYPGGRTNLSTNALDRHVAAGRGDVTALIALDERGSRRSLTYRELLDEVERVAAGLRGLGVGTGDRVTIYMPTSTEAIVAMLATVRIGAIHCVVFAGFGAGALGDRIRASGSRLVLTADVTYRKGKDVDLLAIVDDALAAGRGDVDHVVVLRRSDASRPPRDGELSWDDLLRAGDGHDGGVADTAAEDPAFILATSGTTAKPKLAVHGHGGYGVHVASMGDWVFGLRAGETWWSTSDIGWVVGHSYIVYAPLMAGATTIAWEGALDHPDADSPWSIIERERVTGVFSSPTAIRLLMRYGEDIPRRHDLGSLERLFSAGEVLNAPAWEWLQRTVFEDRVPVIDHMWQTETGGPIFGNPYGLELLPIKPGSAGLALPGIEADIVDADGAAGRGRGEGHHAHPPPVPRAHRRRCGANPSATSPTTGSGSRAATTSATPPTSTTTATSGSPVEPTRSSRSRITGSGRSRSRPRSCATRRSQRPASPASRMRFAGTSSRRSSRCARDARPPRSCAAS